MPDMGHGQRDQRRVLRDMVRTLDLDVTGHCADLDRAAVDCDAGQPADAVEINQELRGRQPHIQRSHQALAAGQQLGIARRAAEQLDRLVHRPGLRVGKWRWLQALLPATFFLLGLLWRRTPRRQCGDITVFTMSIARRNNVMEASNVRNAAWADSVTQSILASGWSGFSGSWWKTSKPARRM